MRCVNLMPRQQIEDRQRQQRYHRWVALVITWSGLLAILSILAAAARSPDRVALEREIVNLTEAKTALGNDLAGIKMGGLHPPYFSIK